MTRAIDAVEPKSCRLLTGKDTHSCLVGKGIVEKVALGIPGSEWVWQLYTDVEKLGDF